LGFLCPAIAIQTCHAPGEGIHEPAAWWSHLKDLHRLPGAPDSIPARILLADRTFATLPAAIAAWGRDRVAVSALVHLPLATADNPDVLLIAPGALGYKRLCLLLSRMAEQPERIERWIGNGLGPADVRFEPSLAGLIALVRDLALGQILEQAGAEVHWRCHDQLDGGSAPWSRVWLPIVSMVSAQERSGEPTRVGVARRSKALARVQQQRPTGIALEELPVMAAQFSEHDGLALDGHHLAGRCEYIPGGAWFMPPCRYGEDADEQLATRARVGAAERYGEPLYDAVETRLAHELAVIKEKGFSSYILTVADLAAGRRTCGRGSGASSLVVYALGITNVDPVRWNLLFERFLSPSRTDPPDLDVDFPWDERDAVFAAALAIYGEGHVAMVSVHTRLRRSGALRAVARAWGVTDAETTAVAKRLRLQRKFSIPADLPDPWPQLLAGAAAVEGTHIHDGLHCGGLIITEPPIRELAPVHPAAKLIDVATKRWQESTMEPVPAIAWEKDGAEQMGLVKIDILGNRSLAVVRDALHDLALQGTVISETSWRPDDDPATQAAVACGNTVGCFYVESPAMRQLLAKANCGDFDHLVVASSIIRPAAAHWIAEYLHRLHHHRRTGRHEDAWYPHPALRSLLSETYGILSYQEDVMLAAQAVAGFTERQANQLRKALGHFDTGERLLKYRDEFLRGGRALGGSPQAVESVWNMIASFSGYSFAKAHSASYAMVSFQAVYLKVHAPAAFHARVIANEGGFYSAPAYAEEGRRCGATLLRPSVVYSEWKTAPEGANGIRLGLHLVLLLSQSKAQRIIDQRTLSPFSSIGDLAKRCVLDARTLLSLARVGALADLRPDLHHAQLVWLAEDVGLLGVHRGRSRHQSGTNGDAGQARLFPAPEWTDAVPPCLRRLAPRREAWERYQALGICVDHHPILFLDEPRPPRRCKDVAAAEHGEFFEVVGMVVASRSVSAIDAKGRRRPMGFATIEDETGLVETVWFPDSYRACGPAIDGGQPLLVRGRIQIEFGNRTITIEEAKPLAFPTFTD
jgi:DNA polymerase-3 subunit alpha/error-prone DNA polymerase